jgi:hypothetical protein
MNETAEAAPMANVDTEVKRFLVREYFGLTIEELCGLDDVVCTFGFNKDEKLVLTGRFAIDRHRGSYRYSDEVVLTVWSTKPPVLAKRAQNKGYYRLEIPLPIGVAIGLFETALHRLMEAGYA